MMGVLKKNIKKTLSTVLGKEKYRSLVEKLHRRVAFDMSVIQDYHLEHTPNSQLVQSGYISKIFNIYYEQKSPQTIVPNKEIASANSYVPFIKKWLIVESEKLTMY